MVVLINDIKDAQWGFWHINPQETVTYILRMAFALLMLKFFHDHITRVPKLIDLLARYSFAVYFIHVAFIMLLMGVLQQREYAPESLLETFSFGLIALVFCVTMSIVFSWLIKRISGRYSRLLIGA